MPLVQIHSIDDPRLTPFRNLKATNDTRWTGRFVAEGDKLVRRLLESNFAVESLLVSDRYLEQFRALASNDVELLQVPDAWIEEIVGYNFHRGILASARRNPSVPLADFCRSTNQTLTLVVCPDVQDPENLGAILRLSGAFGIDAVVVGGNCCDPFSRRVLRVSMGAAFRVPVFETKDLVAELDAVRQSFGVELWATVVDATAKPFDQISRPARLAMLLGSEGHGLSAEWIARCNHRVTIPLRRGTDSLNVAVAAGILLHHVTRSL